MKICFDGIGLSHFKNTGLYTYTFELLNELSTLYPQSQYRVISNKAITSNPFRNKKIDLIQIDLNRRENDYSLLEKYITTNGINIYHSLNNGFSIPQNKVCKYVLTIDTLLPITYPQFADKKFSAKFLNVVPRALENSHKIIVVSKFIKDELINYFNIDEKKIHVIYPCISHMFRPLNKPRCKAILKSKYMIEQDFLLFSGSIHIRKHLMLLLRVFKEILGYYSNINLVIVGNHSGKRRPYYLELKEYAQNLNIDDKVIFTGSVEYRDMPYFYNGALCTINISDYEGFPISSLESLACNTPVICSHSSSFKEVLGHGLAYINNSDFYGLKNALIETMDKKHNNCFRNRLLDIKEYNPERFIKEHVRVYESII
jgi:glycosyltransferase involved in cell wall biosynthesis